MGKFNKEMRFKMDRKNLSEEKIVEIKKKWIESNSQD